MKGQDVVDAGWSVAVLLWSLTVMAWVLSFTMSLFVGALKLLWETGQDIVDSFTEK